ncbi:UvrD-helicase domain-containing protein [Brevibacillus sp. NRS-1366]|uniref:UvrD-helicase domain-containing protein n=1 Tax=Brevibacillus sp. NRS-1366 TaxID=3233899 RepID=UPI003D227B0D
MFNPTPQQIAILSCNDNCVIDAGPGSGKTTTISHKINQVLSEIPWYQGVIAISYTNKASDQLKGKSKSICGDLKNSFFGTIDSFCIANIILPFGGRFFGNPDRKVKVEKFIEDETLLNKILHDLDRVLNLYKDITIDDIDHGKMRPIYDIKEEYLTFISNKFKEGLFDLRFVGCVAYLIFLSSKACRRFFKARFTHLFIDEFQDSGKEQYFLFLRVAELGIISWAIGDVNQSIFGFTNKSSKYLANLMVNKSFVLFPMNINHRCHPSIDLYGKVFLGITVDEEPDEINVFEAVIEGNECDLGTWFNNRIDLIKERFDVKDNSSIVIVARKDIHLELFSQSLTVPFKIHSKNFLDDDQSIWGSLFKRILDLAFDRRKTIYNFVNEYLNRELSSDGSKIRLISQLINHIRKICDEVLTGSQVDPKDIGDLFKKSALLLFPDSPNDFSVEKVEYMFKNPSLLEAFYPVETSQIQLMNLHKVKGLEYEIVIHLDLYNYVLPGFNYFSGGDTEELDAATHLHYVGITRAMKALLLLVGSKRYQQNRDRFISADKSMFLSGDVENYRLAWID